MGENERLLKQVKTYLTEEQHEALRKLAFETRLSIAEHIRKAVDMYLESQTQK